MDKLTVTLVTPLKQVMRGEADMVVAPSVMGQVGILPDHTPLLADLQPGIVEIHAGGIVSRFAVSGGFIEVERNRVSVLAETAERSDEIDVARAQRSLAEAEATLKTLDSITPEFQEQTRRAQRNRARIDVARPS